MQEKVPMSQSRTIQTKLVLPPDTNHLQTIFGGQVLSYIDEIAAITAMKHSKTAVVTASIDSVDFVSSARVGDVLGTRSNCHFNRPDVDGSVRNRPFDEPANGRNETND